MTRSTNKTHYKWDIFGTLDNRTINKKYLSIGDFLEEYGGNKTSLRLDRYKVKRFRDGQKNELWQLDIRAIKEKRKRHTTYFD